MENLNAENVKYGLDCIGNEEDVLCADCVYRKYDGLECHRIVAREALALINSQEQRIAELAEENERLRDELAKAYKALDESVNFYCSFTKSKIQNCPIDDEVAKAKADTVRKMRERLTTFFANDEMLECVEVDASYISECIDQIAKEMLEGEK